MADKSLYFFSTKEDIEPVLQEVEKKHSLTYSPCGLFTSPEPEVFLSATEIHELGISHFGIAPLEKNYLIVLREATIQVREVPQQHGGIRYAMDQLRNPSSVTFSPGGLYEDNYIIRGYFGTASDDDTSLSLYRLFAKEIRKQFKKERSYWLGQEAQKLLIKGFCLTDDFRLPPSYCLQPPTH